MSNASTNILNAVSANIIDFANNAGIDLRNEFSSKDEFKNFVIGMAFKILVEHAGMAVDKAYDLVFGEGSYDSLVEQVWQAAQ
jgi:hypothetical protein